MDLDIILNPLNELYNLNEDLISKINRVKKLPNLSDEEKDKIIEYMKKYGDSFKIDFNKSKEDLNYEYFSPLMKKADSSFSQKKKNVKRSGIAGLLENEDYAEIEVSNPNLKAYIPLTYDASRIIASPKFSDCEGEWCTAYSHSNKYWWDYTNRGIVLIYWILPTTKFATASLSGIDERKTENFNKEDEDISEESLIGKIGISMEEFDSVTDKANLYSENIIDNNRKPQWVTTLRKNHDGSVSFKEKTFYVDLKKNGKSYVWDIDYGIYQEINYVDDVPHNDKDFAVKKTFKDSYFGEVDKFERYYKGNRVSLIENSPSTVVKLKDGRTIKEEYLLLKDGNDIQHRTNGPCMYEWSKGKYQEVWKINNKTFRKDGPAFIEIRGVSNILDWVDLSWVSNKEGETDKNIIFSDGGYRIRTNLVKLDDYRDNSGFHPNGIRYEAYDDTYTYFYPDDESYVPPYSYCTVNNKNNNWIIQYNDNEDGIYNVFWTNNKKELLIRYRLQKGVKTHIAYYYESNPFIVLSVDGIDRYVDPQGNDLLKGEYYRLKQEYENSDETKNAESEGVSPNNTIEGLYAILKAKINPNQFDKIPNKPFEPISYNTLMESTLKSFKTWIPTPFLK